MIQEGLSTPKPRGTCFGLQHPATCQRLYVVVANDEALWYSHQLRFGDVEETGILIAVDEILESKRVRHIDSFIKEHPEALEITSGANKVIYREKEI